MTRTTNARIAGSVFLLYIVTGITGLVLSGKAASGTEGTVATLASMAEHATLVRVDVLLTLLQSVYALVLAVTLYALTREQDQDLAMLALTFRVGEGVGAAIGSIRTVGLLWIATGGATAAIPDAAAVNALGALLLRTGGFFTLVCAIFFALGSTLYAYLFLCARSIPRALAWLGLVASVLLVVVLPAQFAGFAKGAVTQFVWAPMAVFEIVLALWLLIKGVRAPTG